MNLITGATGLLGSHIAEKLRADDQPVRALVRPTSDTRFLESIGVELVPGDITDRPSLESATKGVTTVYHVAAKVGDWGPWNEFVTGTIHGTRNMLDAAKAANVQRFLHVSSISAFGHRNEDGLVIDETHPLGMELHKWSYYSRAKVEAENMVREEQQTGDMPATIVKPSWLYGERDRASMPRIIRNIRQRKAKLPGGGDNLLNLTYAGNEAEGCILAATKDCAIGQNYNLSSDGEITLKEYFNKVAACLGEEPVTTQVAYGIAYGAAFVMECIGHLLRSKNPPLITRYSLWMMARKTFFSPEKARKELGWHPTVNYDEGIERAVKWCVDNGVA
jgi:nucleoside-diphosphate-sugar epimerase